MYKTLATYLQLVFFAVILLYLGRTLFIPLFFGLLIAMIMYPTCRWLELHRCSTGLAIFICLLIVTIFFASLLGVLIWQLNVFSGDAPEILAKIEMAVQQVQHWVVESFGMESGGQNAWKYNLAATIGNSLRSAFEATLHTLFLLFITPVYTALFMYHRKVFIQYLKLVIPAVYHSQFEEILQQSISTYFRYIKGMVMVYLIVGALNSAGLLALGVDHAILFGMLCAIMTIIPYIGLFVSALLPISVIWIETGNIWYPMAVVLLFSVVQYLEANVIFPMVVGKHLQLSTLAMLVAIIAGGIIWGVAGMVLFIPFLAILKIMSDHITAWKPLSLLLGRN